MPEITKAERAYGCAFCLTGKERASAQHIERVCSDVRVIVARQLKQKSIMGKSFTEEKVLFPGYIFFEAPMRFEAIRISNEHIVSVLTSAEGNWQLYGNDARFAQWLFSYDGLVTFSKAYQQGERIRIIEGPLKDLEGQILRIDRRNQSGQVGIMLCNRLIKAWLKFEIVEKAPDKVQA